MLKEHVSKLTDKQLKNRNRFCLGIAIGLLIGMIAVIILSLLQISDQNSNATFTALAPALLMPIMLLPLYYSWVLSSEIKRRKSASSTA